MTTTHSNWQQIAPQLKSGDFTPLESNHQLVQAAIHGWRGLHGFLEQYRGQLTIANKASAAAHGLEHSVIMSTPLSGAFSLGYSPTGALVFLAIESDIFDWMPALPIECITVFQSHLLISTLPIQVAGARIPSVGITINSEQMPTWLAFRETATDSGFVCIRHAYEGVTVEEYSEVIVPLLYAQRPINQELSLMPQ